jgi:hypothetical protein
MHGGWWAMRDRRIVGEVAWYNDADTRLVYWAAFARRDRIPGRFATDDDAKAAVEEIIGARR